MRMSKGELEAREAASFLQGYVAAKGTKTPAYLREHLRTAAGVLCQPYPHDVEAVMELVQTCKKLWQRKIK